MNVLPLEWAERVHVQTPGFAPVTTELLQNIVQRIVAGVRPQKIILFGSYAHGTPSPDSDLDILVIMNTQERHAERVLAVSRLLRPRPFPMDILVRTPDEIAAALEQRDSFIQEILSQGKVLYDQHK
jgi:predicted nucleotidyltransferase